MQIEEMIEELTRLAAEYPGHRVKFRQHDGYLTLPNEITVEHNTFEQWIEIG